MSKFAVHVHNSHKPQSVIFIMYLLGSHNNTARHLPPNQNNSHHFFFRKKCVLRLLFDFFYEKNIFKYYIFHLSQTGQCRSQIGYQYYFNGFSYLF